MPRKKNKIDMEEDPEDNATLTTLLKLKKGKKKLDGTPSIPSPEEQSVTHTSVFSKEEVQHQQTPPQRPCRKKAVTTPKQKKSRTTVQLPNTAVPTQKNRRVYSESSTTRTKKQRKLDFESVQEVGAAITKTEPEESVGKSRNYVPISSLKEAQREWTLKVKILRKGTVDKYKNEPKGPGIYQKYLLQDDKGVVIQATTFNDEIAKLTHQMKRGMTYYLSNGFIKSINKAYANAHESLEIILGPTTCVEPAEMPLEDVVNSYNFTNYDNLQSYMGPSTTVDVIGFVVRVDPLISITVANTDDQLFKRDVVLSNLRSQTIVFTLWADLASVEGETLATLVPCKSVIAVSKAKVVDKNGSICISSLVITTIEIDPKILETSNMIEWQAADHQVTSSNCINIQSTTTYEQLKLNDLITRDFTTFKHSYYSFKGEIIEVTNANNILYNACNTCNKKIEMLSTECSKCGTKESQVTKRYLLKLNVQDETKKASITLFDVAEKVFGCPPNEMDSEDNIGCINNLKGRFFNFVVRVQKSTETTRKNGRFVAHDVQPIDG